MSKIGVARRRWIPLQVDKLPILRLDICTDDMALPGPSRRDRNDVWIGEFGEVVAAWLFAGVVGYAVLVDCHAHTVRRI